MNPQHPNSRIVQPMLLPRQATALATAIARGDLGSSTSHQEPPSSTQRQKKRRQRHSNEEWEEIRPLVAQLYLVHTLEETIKIVEEETGFSAGIRRFRDKIAEWKLPQKNIKAEELQIVLAKRTKRQREDNRDTVVIKDGVKVDVSRLETFIKRQSAVAGSYASPSAPTPEGIEYFTPPSARSEGRSSLAPAPRATELRSGGMSVNQGPLSKYGEDSSPKNIVELKSIRLTSTSRTFTSPFHPFHFTGTTKGIGSGRFYDTEKLLQCFWGTIEVAQIIRSLHQDAPSTLSQHSAQARQFQSHLVPPRYSFHVSSLRSGPVWNEDAILALVKKERFFQNLLGLARQDCAHWLGQWNRMEESESADRNNVALALFGDCSLSYPGAHLIRLIVHFQASNTVAGEMMLQLVVGYEPGEYVRDCTECDKEFVIVDLVGPDGAMKVHLTVPDQSNLQRWKTKEEFISDIRIGSTQTFAKRKDLAYISQGWSQTRVYLKCRCGRRDTDKDHRGHWCNLSENEELQDIWDNEALAEQNQRFDPFPLDGHQQYLIDSDHSDGDSDEEKWDPKGLKGGDETFDPNPEQSEEHSYDALSYTKY